MLQISLFIRSGLFGSAVAYRDLISGGKAHSGGIWQGVTGNIKILG